MAAATSLRTVPRPDEAPVLPGGGLLGHVRFMANDPLDFLLRAQAEHGDLVRLRLGPRTGFVVYDPDDVERVLTRNAANYSKQTRGYHKLRLLLGDGLVTSEGETWMRQRRIAQPAFLRERVWAFGDTMAQATVALAERWAPVAACGGEVDVHADLNQVALRIAGETLFGVDITSESSRIGDAMLVVLERFNRLVAAPVPYPEYWPTLANLRFWRAVRTLHRLTDDIVAERRALETQPHDLLGLFIEARDAETGEGMDARQLRDEALTMLLAGHETTANGLSWALHLLSTHPLVAQKVRAELDATLGGRLPTAADQRALPYLRQVIQETLRLYPPVWMLARHAEGDDTLSGKRVPRGSIMFLPQWAIHRHPSHWQNPLAFDPDRFGPGQPAPHRYAYFPFSRGRRQCIGDRFAELEMVIVLATLLQRYELASSPGHPVALEASVTLRPRHGLRMRLTPR